MRVVFVRVADFERGLSVVARDDGVTYHLADGPVSGKMPHDLVHFAVEDELGIADGIWGAIAGGVVFTSMTHVGGRRPPHAAERSTALMRAHRDGLQRAEALGGFVDRVATGQVDIRWLPRYFANVPGGAFEADDVRRAVSRVHAEAQRWASCPVGAELTGASSRPDDAGAAGGPRQPRGAGPPHPRQRRPRGPVALTRDGAARSR
jgi:hypothetical protein